MTVFISTSQRCYICGTNVSTTSKSRMVYCDECRMLARKDSKERCLNKTPARKSRSRGTDYKIIKDPCKYPMIEGTTLSKIEVKMGIEFGSFVPGMIFERKDGTRVMLDKYKKLSPI